MADLAGRGHLDDAAFARHWVETRSARGYGTARLRRELRARGVAAGLIDAAIAELGTAGVLAQARAVAERRLPALRRLPPERAAPRLRDHLLRRGYSAAVALRVVRELLGSPPESTGLIE